MRNVTIEGQRTDGIKGAVLVSIEPTNALARGALFKVNDHHEVQDSVNSLGCEEMLSVLESNYFTSIETSKSLIHGVLEAYQNANN